MAKEAQDIQLEHGHVRIVNVVVEALALAPLNAGQLKVALAVIRRTWGWQRKDGDISTAELAEATGLARSTAAAALRDLVEAGVVLERRAPTFRSPGRYRMEKDPRKWGRFVVKPPALVSGTPETPESRRLRYTGDSGDESAAAEGDRSPVSGTPETPESRRGVSGTPESPAPEAPVAVGGSPPLKKELKERKDMLLLLDSASQAERVRGVIVAANAGMALNPSIDQQRLKPILSNGGRAQQAVIDWLELGLPAPFLAEVVEDVGKRYDGSQGGQIYSMAYYSRAIGEAWEKRQAGATGETLTRGDRKILRLLRKYEDVDLGHSRGVA